MDHSLKSERPTFLQRCLKRCIQIKNTLVMTAKLIHEPPQEGELAEARQQKKRRRVSTPFLLVVRETWYLMRTKDLEMKSQALTYLLLRSLIPLLAIAFSFFKLFGGLSAFIESTLQPFLLGQFGDAAGNQIIGYLNSFQQKLDGTALGAVGFVTFLFTVVTLLRTVETAFNEIYDVKQLKPLWQRIGSYWVFLSFTPLIIAAASAKSPELLQNFDGVASLLNEFKILSILKIIIGLVFQSLGFSLLFLILPHRRLPFIAVIISGTVTSFLFEALQNIFVFIAKNSFNNASVAALYGTAAIIVILFFYWIQLIFQVLLVGACLSIALARFFEKRDKNTLLAPLESLIHCSLVFGYICKIYHRSPRGISQSHIAKKLKIPSEEASKWLHWLLERGVIFETHHARSNQSLYFPTHKGTRLEKRPHRFMQEVLLVDSSGEFAYNATAAQTNSDKWTTQVAQTPFVKRVMVLLSGKTHFQSPHPIDTES